jgi:hypothetical protein
VTTEDVTTGVGLAAMHWRRLDLVALELEEQTSAAIFQSDPSAENKRRYDAPSRRQQKVNKTWKLAAKAADDAYDEFMALLADSIAEQEVMGE